MNSNTKKRNPNNHTLDLFNPIDTPADLDATPTGDGAQHRAPAEPKQSSSDLPPLEDIFVQGTEPFRTQEQEDIVVPVPVFRLKLVRERDHLTRQIHAPADAARICSELLDGLDREVFLVLALSTANRLIGAHVAHVGTVDASVASPREVFKFALLVNARSVICAHNHPSGNLEPSKADVLVSKQIQRAGESIGIRLLDSLVIGYPSENRPSYTSLADSQLL